jgi:DNA-binding LytR/AlgR family response regulator
MKLKCLIIDDEDLARGVVETYLKDIDFLETVASCCNAIEALSYLNSNSIDILFLDINMPKLDGLSFLKTLKFPPKVIITTAYREFAVEGFELDVVDYLCKPFSFERFLVAVNKTVNRIKSDLVHTADQKLQIREEKPSDQFIFVKADKKTYRVDFDNILFIEAVGDYIKIITTEKSLLIYMNLKDIEKMLPSNLFQRVHRSFLVSILKIDSIEGNRIKIKNGIIPIGRSYREGFLKILGKV